MSDMLEQCCKPSRVLSFCLRADQSHQRRAAGVVRFSPPCKAKRRKERIQLPSTLHSLNDHGIQGHGLCGTDFLLSQSVTRSRLTKDALLSMAPDKINSNKRLVNSTSRTSLHSATLIPLTLLQTSHLSSTCRPLLRD